MRWADTDLLPEMNPEATVGVGVPLFPICVVLSACGLAAAAEDSGAATGACTGTAALGARAIAAALRLVSMGVKSAKPVKYLNEGGLGL